MDQKHFQQNMKQAQQQQKKQEAEETRLATDYDSRSQRKILSLVKPEKAQKIEDMIIQNASMGALKSKVDEQSLITYLEQMNEGDKPTTSIKFKRKIDEDDDFDF